MNKILLIGFCVLVFIGIICAEVFVSAGSRKPSEKESEKDEDSSKKH